MKGNKLKIYTYQKNIELIKLLYDSELANELCRNSQNNFKVLRPIIQSFYKDPDFYDRELFIENNKFNNIEIGLDGLCGWKILFDIHEGNPKWLEDYETIRGSKLGYLLWPNSTDKMKHQTINQLRYIIFGDRIDYTLYDISLFLDKKKRQECRLLGAYQGETKKILENYTNIKDFTEDNNKLLNVFLNDKNEILNILTGKPLQPNEHKDFHFSARWGIKNNKEVWKSYIMKIVQLCRKSEKLEM